MNLHQLLRQLHKSNLNKSIKPIDKPEICGIIYLGTNPKSYYTASKVKYKQNYKNIERSDKNEP